MHGASTRTKQKHNNSGLEPPFPLCRLPGRLSRHGCSAATCCQTSWKLRVLFTPLEHRLAYIFLSLSLLSQPLFASVGQASTSIIVSLTWSFFISLLIHVLMHYFSFIWDLPGDVLAAPELALCGWIGMILLSSLSYIVGAVARASGNIQCFCWKRLNLPPNWSATGSTVEHLPRSAGASCPADLPTSESIK